MRKRVNAAGHCHAEEFKFRKTFGAVFVALFGKRASFHAAYAGRDVNRRSERSRRIFRLRNVFTEFRRVDVATESACRKNHGNAAFMEFLRHIFDEFRTLRNYVFVHGFVQADDDGFHFANGHAAVGEEAFVERNEFLHAHFVFLCANRDSSAAGEPELARREVNDIHERRDFRRDFTDAHVFAGFFAFLDEVKIVLQKRRVEHDPDAVFFAEGGDFAHVLERKRLPADEIRSRFDTDKRNASRRNFFNQRFKARNIEITFERAIVNRFQTFFDDEFFDAPAEARDVRLGRREVEVHRNHVARLDKCGGEDVFRRASLVDGQKVFHAENFGNFCRHTVVGFGSGVSVVCPEHGGLLQVAHGVHAGIGQHVHEDIAVLQKEGVVAGFIHASKAVFRRRQIQFLNNAHLVHFERNFFPAVEFYISHEFSDFR